MNIVVEIKAPELAKAIETLAAAFRGKNQTEWASLPGETQQQAPVLQQPAPIQQAPVGVPVQTQQLEPIQQQAPITQQPMPTSVPVQQQPPSYTQDQLAVAATQLMDAGKRNELFQLLATFGIQALTQLPQEQYGAFATKLREMGARI